MQGAAVLPEEDEEVAGAQQRPGEVVGEEPHERLLQADAGTGSGRAHGDDREAEEGLAGGPPRPCPAPDDVPEIRSEDHQPAAGDDAEEGPVAQEVRRLEGVPEEEDEEDGRQEEEVERKQDDGVDEGRRETPEEPAGFRSRGVPRRRGAGLADPDRRR